MNRAYLDKLDGLRDGRGAHGPHAARDTSSCSVAHLARAQIKFAIGELSPRGDARSSMRRTILKTLLVIAIKCPYSQVLTPFPSVRLRRQLTRERRIFGGNTPHSDAR